MDEFEKFKIKEYDFWDLYLHKNQHPYIGRCYAWAKREDADLVTEINKEETDELFSKIIKKWDSAIKELYNHYRPNIAILGNEAPHLHAHLIPRYNKEVIFANEIFRDLNPNGNYAPYEKKELSLEILLRIKEEIKTKL